MQLIRNEFGTRVMHSGVGAILMIIGSVAAIVSIPADFTSAGDLTLSGVILTLAILAPTVASWRNDTRSLLRGENILLAALVYWVLLDVLQGAYTLPVPRDTVVREFMLLTITALGFWLGATMGREPLAPKFLMDEALRPWSGPVIFVIVSIAWALGIWDFIYRSDFDLGLMLDSLGAGRWDSPWQRESLGDWSAFSYHLQYFGYLVPALTVLFAMRNGWRNPFTWLIGLMALVTLALHAQGGGRRIIGAMVLAGIFCWLIYVRRLNPLRLAASLGAVAALAALMQLMLMFRNIGFADTGSAFSQYDYLHVDDNFLHIAQMLEFVPDSYPFVGFQYTLYALVRPIPRVWWPDKPTDGGFDLAELLGIPNTSFALTAPGELYVSYGFVAAFIGALVYGRLSTMVGAIFRFEAERINPIYPSLLLVWLFVGVRSMLEIMLMGYVLGAVIVLSKLIRFAGLLRAGAVAGAPGGP